MVFYVIIFMIIIDSFWRHAVLTFRFGLLFIKTLVHIHIITMFMARCSFIVRRRQSVDSFFGFLEFTVLHLDLFEMRDASFIS